MIEAYRSLAQAMLQQAGLTNGVSGFMTDETSTIRATRLNIGASTIRNMGETPLNMVSHGFSWNTILKYFKNGRKFGHMFFLENHG